jgi:hypothetical protein
VFSPLVCLMLHRLHYDSTIVTIEIHRTGCTRNNTQLRNKISDPNKTFFAASEAAMSSASIVETATVSCLKLFYLTAPPLRQNIKPDCDLESSISVNPLQRALLHLQTQITLLWFFLSNLGCSLQLFNELHHNLIDTCS